MSKFWAVVEPDTGKGACPPLDSPPWPLAAAAGEGGRQKGKEVVGKRGGCRKRHFRYL